MFSFRNTADLESNIRVHDRISKSYERIHGEIYNDIEQNRLQESIRIALSYIHTESKTKRILDFGCGAGNLTSHLTSLGCEVIASDVSQGFLDLVASRSYLTQVTTARLNGIDLSNFEDGIVDMVATYSVLHHIPDYLAILKEFMRVVKPGGVIYIDHEGSDDVWEKNSIYEAYAMHMRKTSRRELHKYFVLTNYVDWTIRKFVDPRYRREGDIHVFEDDHIEWKTICRTLIEEGGEIVFEKDYLLFKRNYDVLVYNTYKEKISDVHLLMARKNL